MTQKDFEELEAKYNKMIGLKERQGKAHRLYEFIFACTTPSEDPVKDDKRIAYREMYQDTVCDINSIETKLADELLPVVERFCEKLEKEFEEE